MTTKMYSYKRERAKRLYPEPAICNRNKLILFESLLGDTIFRYVIVIKISCSPLYSSSDTLLDQSLFDRIFVHLRDSLAELCRAPTLPECQSLHLDIPADGRAILGRRGNPTETSRRDSCREIAARGKAGVYGKNKKMQQSHP